MMMKEERKRFILSPKMLNIWAHEIQLSYLQKKNEKPDKRNFKEKKENKDNIKN